jgi:broad specificity phosphatase PhoE
VLLLVRHCESEANADGLLLGRTDSPLSERGRRQAAQLEALVAGNLRAGGASRLISSPLQRSTSTAEALGLGLRIEIDERWTEVDYGEFEGEKLTDVPADVWRTWRTDPEFRPPGGETLAELGVRIRGACDELFAVDGSGARSGGDVVVVSHVSPIKAAVAWALGADDSVAWRLWLATASVTVVGWGTDAPVLHRYNIVSATDEDPGA